MDFTRDCGYDGASMIRTTALAALAAAVLFAGCRDMAGGNQIDALQRAKTAAAGASDQAEQRFQEGLRAGSSDADIEAATGEPAP